MARIKTSAPQPLVGDWAPSALVRALRKARKGDRVLALKRSGILTKAGNLAPRFRSWGQKASRTPDAREMGVGKAAR
jgi:hypothetical protein